MSSVNGNDSSNDNCNVNGNDNVNNDMMSLFLVTSVKLFTVLSKSESVSKFADRFFAVIGPDRIQNHSDTATIPGKITF